MQGPVMVPHAIHICPGCDEQPVDSMNSYCEKCRRRDALDEYNRLAMAAVTQHKSLFPFYIFTFAALAIAAGIWSDVIVRLMQVVRR